MDLAGWGRGKWLAAASFVVLASASVAHAQSDTDGDTGSLTLGPIRVEGESANTLKRDTGLSTLPGTVQDTPQAVTVIGKEQMEQQGVTSLAQALRNVPGITIAIGEGGQLNGDQFKIRGIDAKDDIYVDGLRDFGVYTRDSFNYEQVEVLQGPSGATFGRSGAGGGINTTSKVPFLERSTSMDVSAGNGSYKRLTADVNEPLGDTTAMRVNLMLTDTKTVGRDVVGSKRYGIAPSIGFGLGTDLSFTLGYLHQHDKRIPDYGVPILADTRSGQPVPAIGLPVTEYGVSRSNFYGFTSDYDISDADILTGRLKYTAGRFTFTNDSRLGFYGRKFTPTPPDSCNATYCTTYFFDGDPSTAPRINIGGPGPYGQHSWGAQNISATTFDGDFGGFRHQAQVGLDVSYQTNKRNFYSYALDSTCGVDPAQSTGGRPCSKDLYNPSHTPYYHVVGAASGNAVGTGRDSDIGVFASERWWFTPEWSIIGGVRWDTYRSRYETVSTAGALTTLESNTSFANPKASLVFEPSEDQTYYISYAKSAVPQGTSIANSGAGGSISATAKDLEPELNESFEAGAKYSLFHGVLGTTLSIFDIKKNNATQTDPLTGDTLAQSGERQEVRGFSLGVDGALTPNWTANVAYTFLDAKIKESYQNCSAAPSSPSGSPTNVVCPVGVATSTPILNTALIGQQVTYTPKHSASFWTNYNFADDVPGLSVGGGVTYQDKLIMRYSAASNSYSDRRNTHITVINEVPESISLDGVVAYEMGQWRFALNLYNLTDRLNYTQVYSNRAVPAPGRSFVFSVGIRL